MTQGLNILILGWALFLGPLCWILRDGLGPDSMESTGWAAVVKFFFTFYWGPVLLALMLLRLGAGLRHQRKTSSLHIPRNIFSS